MSEVEDDQRRRLARIGFYTGMRLGEIFGLEPHHIRDSMIVIETQMTNIPEDKLVKKEKRIYTFDVPKNGHSREIFYPQKVKADLLAWSKVKMKDRHPFRLSGHAKAIRSACRKQFGSDDPIKLLSFRDLRHCHAIWLLQSGATIAEVAQQIGDGVEVCYRHYTGFELKKESIERFKRLVD